MKNQFAHLYPINKTLRFELRPIGKTESYIDELDIIRQDQDKAINKSHVQELFDYNFRSQIDERLKQVRLHTELLTEFVEKKDPLIADNLKKDIIAPFKDKSFCDTYLKTKEHFKLLNEQNPDDEVIKQFDRFTTYFTNFFDIRKHVFLDSNYGSIAHRLIDDNLPIFYANLEKMAKLPNDLKAELPNLKQIDSLEKYNYFLTQDGITNYNEMIGGCVLQDGTKEQGINEIINLYSQKNQLKLPTLKFLYKMILSENHSNSLVIESIENDRELIAMLHQIIETVNLQPITIKNSEHIYVAYDKIGYLPGVSYGKFKAKLDENYDQKAGNKKHTKAYHKNRDKTHEEMIYSLDYIGKLVDDNHLSESITKIYHELEERYEKLKEEILKIDWQKIDNIKQSQQRILIKDLLDCLQEIKYKCQWFDQVNQSNKPDVSFYTWLDTQQNQLDHEFTNKYNQIRNYLTKKAYSNKKFKLNFQTPQLAGGWDENKEIDYSTILLRKYNEKRTDYDYYLGIWNAKKPKKNKKLVTSKEGIYEKMVYKLFPDASKMLPKLFIKSDKWLADHPLDASFKKKYDEGKHKKGVSFDLSFLHQLIDRYKEGLALHPNQYQKTFNFTFKETKDYQSYSEFIQDINTQNYCVKFETIEDVKGLIDDGTLFLFQIWSKDFSPFSKGTKNLNTIYFESIFSNENLKKPITKLSGGAELFYRQASIQYDKRVEKRGHHYQELKGKFDYPIIKDKRYTQDKYFLHVPIVLNNLSEQLTKRALNERVHTNIDTFEHIIGIDRGERHLVYLSVVNIKTGKIVEQKNLDEIINYDTKGAKHVSDYRKKLSETSKNRDTQRKSWDTIETIKELKEGYISQLVNEIRQMQENHNALIVLENLNRGFKNSRIKIEKQIYQKFETALIKKFNYLIKKSDSSTYQNALQLTNPITTLDEIGNQSGIIFYIPAWNTSKIDPTTGFVNLYYADDLKYKSVQQTQDFMDKIDTIYFKDNQFHFDIDFSKWNDRYVGSKRAWTLSSYGSRINTFRNPEKQNNWDYQEIDLTEAFKKVLKEDGQLKEANKENCQEFMKLFKLMISLRQSNPTTGDDYLISPVANANGTHFDSRISGAHLPLDADANGAYNIARKGLMVIDNIKRNEKNPFYIKNEDYLVYLQNKD